MRSLAEVKVFISYSFIISNPRQISSLIEFQRHRWDSYVVVWRVKALRDGFFIIQLLISGSEVTTSPLYLSDSITALIETRVGNGRDNFSQVLFLTRVSISVQQKTERRLFLDNLKSRDEQNFTECYFSTLRKYYSTRNLRLGVHVYTPNLKATNKLSRSDSIRSR